MIGIMEVVMTENMTLSVRDMSFYSRFSTLSIYSTEFSIGEYFYKEFLQRKYRRIQVHEIYILYKKSNTEGSSPKGMKNKYIGFYIIIYLIGSYAGKIYRGAGSRKIYLSKKLLYYQN